MEVFIPIIAIVMIFGIPITAIISSTYIKSKKLAIEAGKVGIGGRALEKLHAENEELKRRVENLETIVTDPDLLRLHQEGESNKAHMQTRGSGQRYIKSS